MRISDWSSDVCSSDLAGDHAADDGGAGARSAGNHGHALRHAYTQGLLPADLFQRIGRGALVRSGVVRRAGRIARRVVERGRASGRERVCQYVYISGVAVYLNKKKQQTRKNE